MTEQRKIANIHGESERVRPRPFTSGDASQFIGKEIPDIHWHIGRVLVHSGVTLFSGPPGLGKSLLCLQMQVAAALGERQWLGFKLSGEPTTTIGFYCEDELDIIHVRLRLICNHYGVHFEALSDRVKLVCRVGEAHNALMTFKGDVGTRTALFYQMADLIRATDAKITIIDTVADAYQGNENSRPAVREFVTGMRNLAMVNRGGVLLCAHPSVAGLANKTGLSGSTAWEGSVRARVYLHRAKSKEVDQDGFEIPSEERVFRVMKNNYARITAADAVRLEFKDSVLVPSEPLMAGNYWNDR
jgi:RecA-family ATPase